MDESLVSSCCDCSDQEVDETEKQVARCKPEGLDALCRTTKFSRKELQIMYRGFKNVSNSLLIYCVICGRFTGAAIYSLGSGS